MDKENIIKFFQENKTNFLENYKIERMLLFGSYAQGKADKSSDVDIIYNTTGDSKLSFREYSDLLYFIEDSLGKKVDLINIKNLNPVIFLDAKNQIVPLI